MMHFTRKPLNCWTRSSCCGNCRSCRLKAQPQHPGGRRSGPFWPSWFRPLGFATAGFTAAVLLLFTVFQPSPPTVCNNRFVLFEPAADQVELAGSFTGWQRVSMTRAGTSGYWEVNLQVPSGEHRFAYILDGKRQMADPTLPASEKDDFGGQNSILNVEARL
jgi:hypothetical protein